MKLLITLQWIKIPVTKLRRYTSRFEVYPLLANKTNKNKGDLDNDLLHSLFRWGWEVGSIDKEKRLKAAPEIR